MAEADDQRRARQEAWERLDVLAPELVEAGELAADRAEQVAAAAEALADALDGSEAPQHQEAFAALSTSAADFAQRTRTMTASIQRYMETRQ